MDRLGAALEPPDMQAAMGEVDGVPAQRHELARPQPVPVGDQHHGGIAVAVAILPGSIDQAGNLAIGEVLAGADLGVTLAARRAPAIANCPNNGGWRHQRQMRICHDFSGLFPCYCPEIWPLTGHCARRETPILRAQLQFYEPMANTEVAALRCAIGCKPADGCEKSPQFAGDFFGPDVKDGTRPVHSVAPKKSPPSAV